ncbi:NUDIX domain-containing protein [Streptomyces sp. NPDC085946]|uniref:NUDIX domain-containing protein n=1 Tax=Streptomyces sp. NPDC085946 TaxID=3365744 RepID=UPI0037D1562C
MTGKEYGALRASAALWAGTSVLITDERGRVLIQRVDYRTTCLLPGGAVDADESPAQGAARELREELGVTTTVDCGLAVDWVSADSLNVPADIRFPGEILHVYDGGTWANEQIAAIRLPDREIKSVEFVDPARLPDLMSSGDARRALSAHLLQRQPHSGGARRGGRCSPHGSAKAPRRPQGGVLRAGAYGNAPDPGRRKATPQGSCPPEGSSQGLPDCRGRVPASSGADGPRGSRPHPPATRCP